MSCPGSPTQKWRSRRQTQASGLWSQPRSPRPSSCAQGSAHSGNGVEFPTKQTLWLLGVSPQVPHRLPSPPLRPEIPPGCFSGPRASVPGLRTPWAPPPAPQPLPGREKGTESPPGLPRRRPAEAELGQQRLPGRFPAQPAPSPWGPSWKDLQRTRPFLSECQGENLFSESI